MMKETITKEMFEDFCQVAELELTEEEAQSIRAKMNEQMKVIKELEAIPLDESLEPVIRGNPYPLEIQSSMRDDVWTPFDDPEAIIAQAPKSEEGYIVSPDVPHQKLG